MKDFLFVTVLFILSCLVARAARVDTLEVYSRSMDKKIKTVVVVPDTYASSTSRFPVVYLLHGLSDNYSKWVKAVPAIKAMSDQYQMILVCPDGDYGSWYLNSPVKAKSSFETFISKELVSWMDQQFRTVAFKSGRAITGLSMGGHGALYNAIRNPEVFIAAGSMSGAVDLTGTVSDSTQNWINEQIEGRLGSYATQAKRWQEHSVLNMIGQLKSAGIHVLLDCGTEDFFVENNREFHRRLLYEDVSHAYMEWPGGHSWDYWRKAIVYQLIFFNQYLHKQ